MLPQTLILGSLNVRGCGTIESKREEIGRMFDRRRIDVLALSETKMKGKCEVMFGGVVGRMSGIEGGRAREGVGLLLSDRVKQCVIEWKEVNARMMWVKLKVSGETLVCISAYGPGSERDENERNEFWKEMSECIESFGVNVNVIVLGDLNARVGDEVIDGVVGKFGVPGRNESGECLIDMCLEQEMIVGNTCFKKKNVNKWTWVRVDHGRVIDRAVMDYIIVPKRLIGRLLDVHVWRGEASGISDHFLVEGRLKVSKGWKVNGRVVCKKEVLKVSELSKKEKKDEYQRSVTEEWVVVNEESVKGVEEEWKLFYKAVQKCMKEVCGVRRVGHGIRRGSEWWNEDVKKVVKEKKSMYEEWLQKKDAVSYERYKSKRMEVKNAVRKAKREADERWGERLNESFKENSKMFWKELKRVRKGETGSEGRVKDENGKLLVKGEEVRKRWAEYFEKLLNERDEREASIVAVSDGRRMPVLSEMNGSEITEREVNEAINEMKAGKAPGMDGCAVESLKNGGVIVIKWLVRLFNVCFKENRVPEDWKIACVVPLYKGKGDKLECNNSRGISLLSVVGKAYGRILIRRIRDATECVIGEEQCGFRRKRGCMDQVFVVRQVCEKYIGNGKKVFWAFMDLEKAYDRVDRKAVWEVLRMYGVGGNLLKAVKSFYDGSKACVRVENQMSDCFPVNVGLRQGCVMSPWLFNMYMDGIVSEVNARVLGRGLELVSGNGEKWEVCQLLFADDTALVADSEEKLQRLVTEFGRVCDRRKLKVNVNKSKVMVCLRSATEVSLNVKLNGEMLERVESFKYLGSQISMYGGVDEDVRYRVNEASKAWGGMKAVFKARQLGMNVKRRLYEGVIVPTALYGAETWGMKVAEKKKVNVFEMKCLRSMLGVTRMDRIRNEEVRRRVGVVKELSRKSDERLLMWFGHMERMSDERLTKKVMRAKADGRAMRGRPRFGWMDGVKCALNERGLSVEHGREIARNRNDWRTLVDG